MLLSCGKSNNSNTSTDIDGGMEAIPEDSIIEDEKEYEMLGPVDAVICCDGGYSEEEAYLFVKSKNGEDLYYMSTSKEGKKYRVIRNEREVEELDFFPNGCAQTDDGIFYYLNITSWPSQSSSNAAEPSSSESSSSSRTVTVEQPYQPRPMQEWQECSACMGSGRCHVCLGSGKGAMSDGSCLICGFTGRCTHCAGQGGHYITVYR